MYTSYAIEKIASSNLHEALAAAEERRTAARRVPRHSTRPNRGRSHPRRATLRIPRLRRWFGIAPLRRR